MKIMIRLLKCIRRIINLPFNCIKYLTSKEKLRSLKNVNSGKRCFIIGNGPSLTPEDLDKLKYELSFASNSIYKIFDRTDWRPTYYCATDHKMIKIIKKEIISKIKGEMFIGICDFRYNPRIPGAKYVKMIVEEVYPQMPKFSENILNGCYEGRTVTYTAIQIAVYMGFKEIYLLGIDHNYSAVLNPDGTITNMSEVNDHFSDDYKTPVIPALYKTTLAYQAAKNYADTHGIKIYNATRGGKLEVFERVDFDKLFEVEDDEKECAKK